MIVGPVLGCNCIADFIGVQVLELVGDWQCCTPPLFSEMAAAWPKSSAAAA